MWIRMPRLKKKGFTLKIENMKEAIGLQLTVVLGIKFQKYII